jgi:hypothetical protein
MFNTATLFFFLPADLYSRPSDLNTASLSGDPVCFASFVSGRISKNCNSFRMGKFSKKNGTAATTF